VIGVVEENTDVNEPLVQTLPYHPILQSHIEAVHALADVLPHVLVNDTHLQARVLDGPSGSASVVVANRWTYDIDARLATVVADRQISFPPLGTFVIPGSTGLILPINYPLGSSHTLLWATAQLLSVTSSAQLLTLEFVAPGGGAAELSVTLAPSAVAVNGKSVTFTRTAPGSITIGLPAGQPTVSLTFA
jgi:hypothetical protein